MLVSEIRAHIAHVSALVEHVVGKFNLLERHRLLQQLVSAERRVWMRVDASRQRRVCFAGDEPRRPVVGIPIALVINRHDVHQHGVTSVSVQPSKTHSQRRKHPSEFANIAHHITFVRNFRITLHLKRKKKEKSLSLKTINEKHWSCFQIL